MKLTKIAIPLGLLALVATGAKSQTFKSDYATQVVLAGAGGTNPINTLTLITNASQASALKFTFPATAGTTNYVLATDGSGNLSWVNPGTPSLVLNQNNMFVGNGSNIAAPLAPTANSVLITDNNNSGTPQWATTLPSGLTIPSPSISNPDLTGTITLPAGSVSNADLANSTIGTKSSDNSITVPGTMTLGDVGDNFVLNLTNANIWTGEQTFSAAGTGLDVTTNASVGGNLGVTGSTSTDGLTSTGGISTSGGTNNLGTTDASNTNIGTGSFTNTIDVGNGNGSTDTYSTTNLAGLVNLTGTVSFSNAPTFPAGSIPNSELQNSTIGLTSSSSTLTVTGSPIALGSSGDVELNLTNANIWTGEQTFSAAGTGLDVTTNASVGGNLGVTGSTSTDGLTSTGGLTSGGASSNLNNADADAVNIGNGTNEANAIGIGNGTGNSDTYSTTTLAGLIDITGTTDFTGPVNIPAGDLNLGLAANNIYIGNGASPSVATGAPVTGDVSATYSSPNAVLDVNSVQTAAGSSIVTAINTSGGAGGINGTQVNPNFGAQNVSTSGTLGAGAITGTSLTSDPSGTTAGLTFNNSGTGNDVTGTGNTWSVTNTGVATFNGGVTSTGGLSTSGGTANINSSSTGSPQNTNIDASPASGGTNVIGNTTSTTDIYGALTLEPGTTLTLPAGSVTNADLAHDAITFTSSGNTLSETGTGVLGTTVNYDINLAQANAWTGEQTLSATGTALSVTTGASFSGQTTLGSTALSAVTLAAPSGAVLALGSASSNYLLTDGGAPQSYTSISGANASAGQVIVIVNGSTTPGDYITLTNGSGMPLNGAPVIIGDGGTVTLMYDATVPGWRLISAQ